VLQAIQGVHTLAGTTRSFFTPALTAGLWLLAIKELLSEILHIPTVLYASKTGRVQVKLDTCVICDFFFGQTARSYRANGTSF
jgi:hypothetical protein